MTIGYRHASWTALFSLMLALTTALPGLAHSNLIGSEPAPNEVVEFAPKAIKLIFAEPVDPKNSFLEVIDRGGKRVDKGSLIFERSRPNELAVELNPVGKGVYTVRWKVLSLVDGHFTRASYTFGVGEVAIFDVSRPSVSLEFSPIEVIYRTMLYFSQTALIGASIILLGLRNHRIRTLAVPRARRIYLLSASTLLGANLLGLAFQIHLTGSVEFVSDRLIGLLLIRTMVASVLLVISPLRRIARDEGPGLVLGLAGVHVFATTLVGHATTSGSLVGALANWGHMIGSGIWAGGVITISMLVLEKNKEGPSEADTGSAVLQLFPRLAILGTSILALTGLYNLWLQAGSWEALLATFYGNAALAKIALVIAALMIGTSMRVSRQLDVAGKINLLRIRRRLRIEALLVLSVLITTGLLASISPAVQDLSLSRPPMAGLALTQTIQGLRTDLRISPGEAGFNSLTLTVDQTDFRIIEVQGRFKNLEINITSSWVRFERLSEGAFGTSGLYFTQPGNFVLQVLMKRIDASEVISEFNVKIPQPMPPKIREFDLPSSPFHLISDGKGTVWLTLPNAGLLASFDTVTKVTKTIRPTIPRANPVMLALADDGTIWFTAPNVNSVVSLDPKSGTFKAYGMKTEDSLPWHIMVDEEGLVWTSELKGNATTLVDPATGRVTEFRPPGVTSGIISLASDGAGKIWFVEVGGSLGGRETPARIGYINKRTGETVVAADLGVQLGPTHIVVAEGFIWIAEHGGGRIDRYDPRTGALIRFLIPKRDPNRFTGPFSMVYDGKGKIWLMEHLSDRLGLLATDFSSYRTFNLPANDTGTSWVTLDPVGNVWFAEAATGHLGVLTSSKSLLRETSTELIRDSWFGGQLTLSAVIIASIASVAWLARGRGPGKDASH